MIRSALYFLRDAALVAIGAFMWLIVWSILFLLIAWGWYLL